MIEDIVGDLLNGNSVCVGDQFTAVTVERYSPGFTPLAGVSELITI